MRSRSAVICGACIAISGCAGDGAGLDENGRPIGESPQTLEPTFASIQSNVLTPICTTCHAGAAAPLGLRLDEGAAYAMLVNAPSVEAPTLLRVAPGNPDASYLIHKIEGTASVGGRMPLNGPPLSPETIAIIRQWITDGAPASDAAAIAGLATLKAVWPTANASLHEPPGAILVSANAELDTSLLGANVISVRASGGDGDFTNGNEIELDVRVEVRSLDPTVIAVRLPESALPADLYELRANGGAPLALADRMAQPIDGDEDGAPGGDFLLQFNVEVGR